MFIIGIFIFSRFDQTVMVLRDFDKTRFLKRGNKKKVTQLELLKCHLLH